MRACAWRLAAGLASRSLTFTNTDLVGSATRAVLSGTLNSFRVTVQGDVATKVF